MADVFPEVGQVVLTSLLSLAAMFIFTRAGGKRQIAQMSPFDYLNAVTVGSIGAELATNLEQWWRPFSALVVYGLVTWFVHYTACKSNAMRSLWSGRSLILMDGGVILKSSLQRAAIDVNEFLGQARVAGYFDPNEIETAILETNGQISFLPKSCSRPLTPDDMQLHPDAASTWYDLIIDGHLMQDNLKAAGRDERWLDARDEPQADTAPAFIQDVVAVMNRQEGDSLPVSTMVKYGLEDGTWPAGTSQYEKRGAAVEVPAWDASKCIQCNKCSLVCPHAAIRPVLLDSAEEAAKPTGFETVPARGMNGKYTYRIQVSPYDCTGCGSCVNVCLAKETAIAMRPLESQVKEAENWTYAVETVAIKQDAVSDKNVKASQFAKPYFEFSGACAGCGETPYIKLVTQLFGDRMYITNASGCSSAYGGSTPSFPYCTDKRGRGPAWAMSLFEDNAEYAYGYLLGQDAIQRQLREKVQILLDRNEAAAACRDYLEKGTDAKESRAVSDALLAALEGSVSEEADFIRQNREYLTKKSVWAYDIGYGGLDHVLASGIDVNILVVDNELYANTGGQASKATPIGAVAQFAASGKKTPKKDLGMIAMNYGHVYVAQVSMGANPAHVVKALKEAEAHKGPSLVIAYAPCINHGIAKSMKVSQAEQKLAVECGYWPLFRYSPELAAEGKNPFQLDSKAPNGKLREFMMGEVRFSGLTRTFPQIAEQLFAEAEEQCAARYAQYEKLAAQK